MDANEFYINLDIFVFRVSSFLLCSHLRVWLHSRVCLCFSVVGVEVLNEIYFSTMELTVKAKSKHKD